MQELFRFYAVRSPETASGQDSVSLDTNSAFQAGLGKADADPALIIKSASNEVKALSAAVKADHDKDSAGMNAFAARLTAISKDTKNPPTVDTAVQQDFGQSLAVIAREGLTALPRLKDLLAALRIVKALWKRMDARAPDLSALPPLSSLFLQLRIRNALAAASQSPTTLLAMKGCLDLPIVFGAVDWVVQLKKNAPAKKSAAEIRAERLALLGDLERLIQEVVAACPFSLLIDPLVGNNITLALGLRQRLATDYKDVITGVNGLSGAQIKTDLATPWLGLYNDLVDKAVLLQGLLDDTVSATPQPTGPAPSLTVGGHMQLAGVADVHVVLSHVVEYSKAEISQIENILLGEKRDRKFRTLTRDQSSVENMTDTTTTQEKDVKTEDRSDLKSETDATLKEALSVKAGLDVTYKPSDSLTLKVNASVDYSRNKEEANKVASEFAKDVTTTAANKVVTEVKKSVKTQTLLETEETVRHLFDNPTSPTAANVSGVYRWIESTHENVHLTVGGPAAIFDGIVLQPAQRLLQQPANVGIAAGSPLPPPALDIAPQHIHPWNYLSLAAKFGASSLPAPPAIYVSAGFSSATADTNPQGLAHDIPLPDGYQAAWGWVVFDAQDRKDDDPSFASARASLGGNKLVADTGASGTADDAHAILQRLLILAGQRELLPFAALIYDAVGYECTIDVACIRTPEAYASWQLAVYSALSSARAQAQQDFDERSARAQLQTSYLSAPSPGQIQAMIKEEIKRCAIGVLATQSAGQNIYDRLGSLYHSGDADDIARLCLIFEHAFAWENISYVLYPYFWADPAADGWAMHAAAATTTPDESWAEFLRAGAARVVVPVRDGFVRGEALGITDPANPTTPSSPNPLQMLQEDVSAILDATLTFDDLLSITSPKTFSAAQEAALKAQVIDQWTEVDRWNLKIPTELVMLQPLKDPLPGWKWDTNVDLSKGVADAWIPAP